MTYRCSALTCRETRERDDGISLEPVDGDESLYWVHIHVANPSAFLDKSSPIARYAGKVTASIYLPERVYPMMESELSQKYFSLAKDRPCITFSAKISMEGDILEKKVTHGIVHDVRYLDLQEASQALGSSDLDAAEKDRMPILQVGGGSSPPRSRTAPPCPEVERRLDASDIEVLRKLLGISKALQGRREREGAIGFGQTEDGLAVPEVFSSRDQTEPPAINVHQTRHIIGDPIITINQTYRALGGVSKMVGELMVLGGQICAMWCSERNIPVPYRGVVRNPDPSPSPEAYRENFLDPAIALRGHADYNQWLTYMHLVGAVYASSSPLEHVALGLPAYCKTTSPLRRYGDLFAHWQIEAAMRHEHATQTSLIGSDPARYEDDTILPFSHSQVEDVARTTFAREKQIQSARQSAVSHWISQALHRAFYFNEAPLPEFFEITVRVTEAARMRANWGTLTGWNRAANIRAGPASRQEGGYRLNDVWEGRLMEINLYENSVILEPVRLVHRETNVG